jgi:hypothetical protein
MNSEGWERPLVGTGVGQRGVDAIRQRGVGPVGWLAGLGNEPIGLSPRVMNSIYIGNMKWLTKIING